MFGGSGGSLGGRRHVVRGTGTEVHRHWCRLQQAVHDTRNRQGAAEGVAGARQRAGPNQLDGQLVGSVSVVDR